jgi:indolepyruvate ferredoxin oxidoreductase beta subunit
MEAGYDVKMSEIHGMSQRGGNVSTQVRFGDKVFSPIIGKGEADLIVAFEKMEALRWIEYLKPGGRIVINDAEIPSVPIQMGVASYPEGIAEELAKKATTYVFKATDLAEELGNPKSMNMILLGALVKAIDLPQIDWEEIIKRNIKPAFVDINLKAFQVGQAQVSD